MYFSGASPWDEIRHAGGSGNADVDGEVVGGGVLRWERVVEDKSVERRMVKKMVEWMVKRILKRMVKKMGKKIVKNMVERMTEKMVEDGGGW